MIREDGLRMKIEFCNFLNYFQSIYTRSEEGEIDVIFDKMHKCISYEMIGVLMKPFTKEEIWIGVKGMPPSKLLSLMDSQYYFINGISTFWGQKFLLIV